MTLVHGTPQRGWARALAAGALVALGAFVLAPTLSVGFEFDDRADAIDNPAATPGGFAAALGSTNRPLTKASYALQRAWTGADPLPFHLANLALHLACALTLLVFVRCVAERLGAPGADLVAWLAAALWALHPASVEAVAPVVGRSVLLSTLLVLGALLLATQPEPPGRAATVAIALLACAAPLARETALVLPALALVWQLTLGADEPRRIALRRHLPIVLGAAAGALLVAASTRQRELLAFSFETRSPLESLRGNVPALFELLALWFVPGRLSVDPGPPADLPWGAPALWVGVILVALAATAFVAGRRRWPGTAFALGFTLVAFVPSSSIVWRLDPVAPRALYLASIGLVVAVALALGQLATGGRRIAPPLHPRTAPAIALLAGVALIGAAAAAAHARARLWTEPTRLWADAALKAPERSRPWLNLGVELMIADRLDAAEIALRRAMTLDPSQSNIHCALDALRARRAGKTRTERSELR